MDFPKSYFRRSLVLVAVFMTFFFTFFNLTSHIVLHLIQTKLSLLQNSQDVMHSIWDTIDQITVIQLYFKKFFIPISAAIFAFLGFLMWFSLKRSLENLLAKRATDTRRKTI